MMNRMGWHRLRGALCQGCRVEAEGGEGTLGGGTLSTESLEAEGAWSEGSSGGGLGGQVATAAISRPSSESLPGCVGTPAWPSEPPFARWTSR